MNTLKLRTSLLTIFCFALLNSNSFAQEGQVTINQDENINRLLTLKKELNKNEVSPDRFKIQIYSGSRAGAHAARKDYNEAFTQWPASIHYEEPNFKIWVGNFRTKIEAERAYRKVKRKFMNSIIFKPRKKK